MALYNLACCSVHQVSLSNDMGFLRDKPTDPYQVALKHRCNTLHVILHIFSRQARPLDVPPPEPYERRAVFRVLLRAVRSQRHHCSSPMVVLWPGSCGYLWPPLHVHKHSIVPYVPSAPILEVELLLQNMLLS